MGSVKYEEVYLRAYDSVSEARASIGGYLAFTYRCGKLVQTTGATSPLERSKENRMANWRVDILGSDLAPNVELNIESRADETMQAGDTLYFRNSENVPDKGGAIFVDRSEAVIMKGTDRWRIEKLNDLWKVIGAVE